MSNYFDCLTSEQFQARKARIKREFQGRIFDFCIGVVSDKCPSGAEEMWHVLDLAYLIGMLNAYYDCGIFTADETQDFRNKIVTSTLVDMEV